MSKKLEDIQKRHILVKTLISAGGISNQTQLQKVLKQKGVKVTQATLSRDLKALQVIKVSDAKAGYAYRLPTYDMLHPSTGEALPPRLNFLADGVLGIEFSGNLGVIKTLPGFASSTALAIDESGCSEIIGTIAGDDTILLVLRDGIGKSDVIRALVSIMPKLESRL